MNRKTYEPPAVLSESVSFNYAKGACCSSPPSQQYSPLGGQPFTEDGMGDPAKCGCISDGTNDYEA